MIGLVVYRHPWLDELGAMLFLASVIVVSMGLLIAAVAWFRNHQHVVSISYRDKQLFRRLFLALLVAGLIATTTGLASDYIIVPNPCDDYEAWTWPWIALGCWGLPG
jgi:hypothetical protein